MISALAMHALPKLGYNEGTPKHEKAIMPLYNPDHIEYNITTANIQISMEDGRMLPAYWAHPTIGRKMPGIALIHDWWGVTDPMRRMANLFAQTGYYVIVPDMFNGKTATTHQEALALVNSLGDTGYKYVDTTLTVLERHNQSNSAVGAVGFGLGGSFAFEAAILRKDLEAAIAFGGFPQRYKNHFHRAHTPILAFYGSEDQFVPQEAITTLTSEFAQLGPQSPHEVAIIDGLEHDFFKQYITQQQRPHIREVWHQMIEFLDKWLTNPYQKPAERNKRFL